MMYLKWGGWVALIFQINMGCSESEDEGQDAPAPSDDKEKIAELEKELSELKKG